MADTTGKIKVRLSVCCFIFPVPYSPLLSTCYFQEPLARITFSAFPTCHDVNQFTRSHERLDVIIGFSTGDVIWFDPMASRYARINKGGVISASPCVQVRWMPGSESLFMTAHQDGCMIVYDKDREDALSFVPTSFIPPPTLATVQEGSGTTPGYFKEEEQQEVLRAEGLSPDIPGRPGLGARIPTNSTTSSVGMPAGSLSSIISTAGEVRATASENGSTTSAARNRPTWNPRTTMIVTRPGAGNAAGLGAKTGMMGGTGVSGKGKETPWAKMNPVTHWRVSRKRITGAISSGLRHMRSRRFLMLTSHFPPSLVDFAFSPDLVHVAVVSEDGILRVVDLTTER